MRNRLGAQSREKRKKFTPARQILRISNIMIYCGDKLVVQHFICRKEKQKCSLHRKATIPHDIDINKLLDFQMLNRNNWYPVLSQGHGLFAFKLYKKNYGYVQSLFFCLTDTGQRVPLITMNCFHT